MMVIVHATNHGIPQHNVDQDCMCYLGYSIFLHMIQHLLKDFLTNPKVGVTPKVQHGP